MLSCMCFEQDKFIYKSYLKHSQESVYKLSLQNECVQILKYHLAKIFNISNQNCKPPLTNFVFTNKCYHNWLPSHASNSIQFWKINLHFLKPVKSFTKGGFSCSFPYSVCNVWPPSFKSLENYMVWGKKYTLPFWEVIRQSIQFILNSFSFPLVS